MIEPVGFPPAVHILRYVDQNNLTLAFIGLIRSTKGSSYGPGNIGISVRNGCHYPTIQITFDNFYGIIGGFTG
jgi:hypothetical protein